MGQKTTSGLPREPRRWQAPFNHLATSLPEFVYVVLLRPKPLKRLANAIILSLLPKTVRYGNAVVVLNPNDPVVSGALTLRVYERSETAFFLQACEPGMTVLDVGANVGYYTALASQAVGPGGLVLALEPDPENYDCLRRTVEANQARNVRCFQVAAAESDGRQDLFRSSTNRADNRLYETGEGWSSVRVETVVLDHLLESQSVATIDIFKVDVQGAESRVIRGLENTLRRSESLVMMMEFWPEGLRKAGADPLELVARLKDIGFRLYELNAAGKLVGLGNPADLIQRLPGRKYTNVVGIKGTRFSRLEPS